MDGGRGLSDRVEALCGLLDGLCAPDLTLAEAKALRARLFGLLDPGPSPRDPLAPCDEPNHPAPPLPFPCAAC
jgi:hypothetical protein